MHTHLSFCLMFLFLYHIHDHWLVLVWVTVCSLLLAVQCLPSLIPHYQQGAFVGLAVVLSLKQHLLCKIHWVVLALPLSSYSNWILSSLDDRVKLLSVAHTDKNQVVDLRLKYMYIKVKLVVEQ